MKLDIIPLHDKDLCCFEDSIATVAVWAGYDYQLMFTETIGVIYENINIQSPTSFGSRLSANRGDISALVGKYHGLEMIKIENENTNIEELVNKEIKNSRPVITVMDTFWLPWENSFKKIHDKHGLLVIGHEEDNGIYDCLDPFYMKQNLSLPPECLKEGCLQCICFNFKGDQQIHYNWREIISSSVETFYASKTINNLLMFSEEIKKYFELTRISGVIDDELIRQLSLIERGKFKYSKFLDYLGKKHQVDDLIHISKDFMPLGYKWGNIRAIIAKAFFIDECNSLINKVAGKIVEVANIEDLLFKRLSSILQKNSYSLINIKETEDKKTSQLQNTEIRCLDLSNYFNNNGFGQISNNTYRAGLTGIGGYFLPNGLPENNNWQVDDMKFIFPEISEVKNNNISCCSQVLQIDSLVCESIMLLGCAEWGNFCDSLIIKYSDGKLENLNISFTDWVLPAANDEMVAWEGKGTEIKDGEIQITKFKHYIFSKKYKLEHCGKIVEIVLPDCPNIHLFAISLGIIKQGNA